MEKKFLKRGDYLIKNIPSLLKHFYYREGPSLYFYKKIISLRRKNNLSELFKDNLYFEFLYATLVSWDMNSRGAKMKYFNEFKKSILENRELFFRLEKFKINQFQDAKEVISKLYDGLSLMKSGARLVSNSKLMHFILPDLLMPMDGANSLNFFYGNTGESKRKYLNISEMVSYIADQINLIKYIDDRWNQSIPKIIDNAIISAVSLSIVNNKK